MKKPKHTQFKDFNNFNYGLKNFTYYRNLSQEEKRAFVNDWHNIALHPILDCDNSWLIFFENMTEREFFDNISNQPILCAIQFQNDEIKKKIKKVENRILKYRPVTENNAKKVEKLEKKLKKLQNDLKISENNYQKVKNNKRLCIAIDANSMSEKYVDKVIKLFNKLYQSGVKELKILVASSDKSKDSKIEYYYNNEQLSALERLNDQLDFYNKTSKIKNGCQLKFSELFNNPCDILEYQELWNFEHVKNVNNFIEEMRITIKNKKLSPLEAVLFIYQSISNSFYYNDLDNLTDADHTIIGALSEKQLITCGGFASFFKIAVDVLEEPNLKAKFISTLDCISQDEHSFNTLSIHDKKYLNKGGTYIIDLTCDTGGLDDEVFGFSGFLAKMKDLINEPNRLSLITNNKSRIDEIFYDFDVNMRETHGQMRNKDSEKLLIDIYKKFEKQTKQIEKIDSESENIGYFTIIKAYLNMLEKLGIPYTASELECIIQQTCLNILFTYPKGTTTSWLKLLNLEKFKSKFGEGCFIETNSSLKNFAKDKISRTILNQRNCDEIADYAIIEYSKECFTKEYFDLLKYVSERAKNQYKHSEK